MTNISATLTGDSTATADLASGGAGAAIAPIEFQVTASGTVKYYGKSSVLIIGGTTGVTMALDVTAQGGAPGGGNFFGAGTISFALDLTVGGAPPPPPPPPGIGASGSTKGPYPVAARAETGAAAGRVLIVPTTPE